MKYYVGDVGTEILVDTGSDISSASTLELRVKKPDGTTDTWTGTLDGTDSISYTTVSGDFDQSGEWTLQAYVVLPSWTGRGESVAFTLYDSFE